MKNKLFRGAATALVTPFLDGKIDYTAYEKLLARQTAAGIDALVVCGTTGESAVMTDDERTSLTAFTVKNVNGRCPVIAGVGACSTEKTITSAKAAANAGADGLLVVTPYYVKPTNDGLIRHFTAVSDAVDIPVILYNVPSRTGCVLESEVCRTLSVHNNIIGIKDAGDSLYASAVTKALCGKDFALYAGNDASCVPVISSGGDGVISVVSNLIPERMVSLCRSALRGEREAAAKEQTALTGLIRAMFLESNPIPVKTALAMMGLCREEWRLPLCEMRRENRETLERVLREYGITE